VGSFCRGPAAQQRAQVNKDEEDAPCAAREARVAAMACGWFGAAHPRLQVYEETGFDVSEMIVESDFVETFHNQNRTKLYIVADVDEQARCLLQLSSPPAADGWVTDGVCASDTEGDQQHRMALD